LHVELDEAKRVLRPGLLHDPAVLPGHVVAVKVACALASDLLALDRAWDGPGRIGDEPVDRRPQLRRFRTGLADYSLADVCNLAITPVDEARCGNIYLDAGGGS